MYQLLREYLSRNITITDEQMSSLRDIFKPKITKRNEILLEPGSICKHWYFVNKGCFRVYLRDDQGREATRYLINEGNFGTAFPSFILQEPSPAYIQSIEPSEVLFLTYHEFRKLPEILPGWEKLYTMLLEQDYIASVKRIESMITLGTKERYAVLMKENPDLIKRLPSKIIADYLGMSQETLSRLKAKK